VILRPVFAVGRPMMYQRTATIWRAITTASCVLLEEPVVHRGQMLITKTMMRVCTWAMRAYRSRPFLASASHT
jgi:hypothetical protein